MGVNERRRSNRDLIDQRDQTGTVEIVSRSHQAKRCDSNIEPERIRMHELPAAITVAHVLSCAGLLHRWWWSTGTRGSPDEPLTNGGGDPSPTTGGARCHPVGPALPNRARRGGNRR